MLLNTAAAVDHLKDRASIFCSLEGGIPESLLVAFAGHSHLIELRSYVPGDCDTDFLNRVEFERVVFVVTPLDPPGYRLLIEKALKSAGTNVGIYIQREDAASLCAVITNGRNHQATVWHEANAGLLIKWLWYSH